jgi:hypothetical protein
MPDTSLPAGRQGSSDFGLPCLPDRQASRLKKIIGLLAKKCISIFLYLNLVLSKKSNNKKADF